MSAHDTRLIVPADGLAPPNQLTLRLARFGPERAPRAVLLLHGANTSADIFHRPHGGLVQFLVDEGLQVWVLDWRGSPRVITPLLRAAPLGGCPLAERAVFNFEQVAAHDIRCSLDRIRAQSPGTPISVLGFCVGAAALSLGLANDLFDATCVDRVLLMTAGLFFRTHWETWLKSREYVLDQVATQDLACRSIDPHLGCAWPAMLEELYGQWPRCMFADASPEWFKRLTFMYGEPYSLALVDRVCHADNGRAGDMFGPLHMGLYLNAARLVRRGYAREVLGEARGVRAQPGSQQAVEEVIGRFRRLRSITLLGGAQNRLWHRESLDRMQEWLLRGTRDSRDGWCRKSIVRSHAHLDLLFGKDAKREVYPRILDAVG